MLSKEETAELVVNPNAFHIWLKEKESTTVIGISGDAASCPLARFLTQSGIKAYVHPDHIAVVNPQNGYFFAYILYEEDIGDWVAEFIRYLDIQYPGEITASAALEVLDVLQDIC